MGICKKCKKKTDLYCFKHKHSICAACLVAAGNEHSLCYVGSYSDFLHLSAEDVAALVDSTCPICAEAFAESQEILRLPCLHLIHQKCLEKVVSELPADTARGGFTCPKCNKPIFNSNDVSDDKIASALASRLRDLPWAAAMLSTISSNVAPQPSSEADPSSASEPSTETAAAAATTTEKSDNTEAKEASEASKPSSSPVVSIPSAPPSSSSSAKEADSKPDAGKPSASSLFIQKSKNATNPPPSSQQQQQQQQQHPAKQQPRSTVATGLPGVGLFVPPPPPKKFVEMSSPVNPVMPSGPVDSRNAEDMSGDDYLNIQIPPLGRRATARKGHPLGSDYRSSGMYDDEEGEKVHNNAFTQVAHYFGLTKRDRGRVVVDQTKVFIACIAFFVILFLIYRLLALMKATPAEMPTPTPGETLPDPAIRKVFHQTNNVLSSPVSN